MKLKMAIGIIVWHNVEYILIEIQEHMNRDENVKFRMRQDCKFQKCFLNDLKLEVVEHTNSNIQKEKQIF